MSNNDAILLFLLPLGILGIFVIAIKLGSQTHELQLAAHEVRIGDVSYRPEDFLGVRHDATGLMRVLEVRLRTGQRITLVRIRSCDKDQPFNALSNYFDAMTKAPGSTLREMSYAEMHPRQARLFRSAVPFASAALIILNVIILFQWITGVREFEPRILFYDLLCISALATMRFYYRD